MSEGHDLRRVRSLIRDVPDFPQPGVLFRDLSPVLADASAFAEVIGGLCASAVGLGRVDAVLGIEARGFVLGAAVAQTLRLGMVCARKPGRLPVVAHRADYTLEYGTASLELAADTLHRGQRVLVVDDVLATGGTLAAAAELVAAAGASVAGMTVAVEITGLGGRARLGPHPLHALLTL